MRSILGITAAALTATLVTAQSTTIYGGSVVDTGGDCVGSNNMIYEQFQGSSFDLDNSSLEFIPNGLGGYIAVPSVLPTLPFPSPTAVDIGAGDDTISAPQVLGFSFPYPTGGGTTSFTNAIEISSNGYIYLQPSTITTSRCCHGGQTGVFSSFRNDGPSFALFGHDPNPAAGGVVWFDVQQVGPQQVAVITWDFVPGDFAPINCQIQLWDDGRALMTWFGVSDAPPEQSVLVGWSQGGGQPDLGMSDLTNVVDGGDGHLAFPLRISSAMQPIVGDPFILDVNGLPNGTTLAALLIGAVPTALDLAVIGAPGCGLYTNGDIAAIPFVLDPLENFSEIGFGVIPEGATGNAGVVLETQAIALVPGFNSLGLATSNGARITIGTDLSTVEGLIVQLEGDSVNWGQVPFWNVRNASTTGENILSVTFDLYNGGPAVANGISHFDPDGNPIAFSSIGDFEAGNSSLTGGACMRLNSFYASDWATGLVYFGTPISPCDPQANTGWVGTNPLPGGWGTIKFTFNSFNPGDVFTFDADVDGGPEGANGLHEVLVTIVTDQRTVSGQLIPIDSDTSIVAF